MEDYAFGENKLYVIEEVYMGLSKSLDEAVYERDQGIYIKSNG
jgi:hypothetical protein